MTRRVKRTQRTERAAAESRDDRNETENRVVTEDRELSDSERISAFRQTFYQSSLPDLPKIPGHHVCWLTTANPRDSIASRMRIGYQLIKASEIPGWEIVSMKSAEYEGCISINEMIAAKLPLNLYEAYMQEAHHNRPNEEEGKLALAAQLAEEQAKAESTSGNAPLIAEPGQEALGKHVPHAPSFSRQLGES